MIQKLILLASMSMLIFPIGCSCAKSIDNKSTVKIVEGVNCWQIDPLVKVFQEDKEFKDNPVTAEVAKGETALFQFVLRPDNVAVTECTVSAGSLKCGSGTIKPTLEAFVDYVKAGLHCPPASKDAMFPASDYYPDCLEEINQKNIMSGYNQPVYLAYDIPVNAKPGEYSATVRISGKINGQKFTIKKEIKAKIYDVTVPEQTLWITNWHDHKGLTYMSDGERVGLFSERYWELLKELVHMMKSHRQNMYYMNPLLDYVKCELHDGQYTFDFTNFDKTVEFVIREGGIKRIEGGQLSHRTGDWDSDYGIDMPIGSEGLKLLETPEAQTFLSQFIPALYAHLDEKGWTDMYYQHIGDEPSEGTVDSYIAIAKYVKELAPAMKVMEAVHSHRLDGLVDVWIPQLDYFDQNYDFYKSRQDMGDEMWFYTCCAPKGNYANRFLELPLVQMRILHWINFKYGATGYLHWGFNQDWKETLENIATEGTVPGGDTYIVYPAYNKVYSSLRLESMRDGIADYELLKLLESRNPAMAEEIVNSVVLDFDSYNSDIDNFRKTRTRLLTELEKL